MISVITVDTQFTVTWVTRPESPKGTKDEVKRPEGLQLEVEARRAPRLLV